MPTISIVIFGATGDLTSRKLIPSLYRLFLKGRLPAEARIAGLSRSPLSDEGFRERLAPEVKQFVGADWDEKKWATFAGRIFYLAADATKPDGLKVLNTWLEDGEKAGGGQRLYYLAVAPQLYPLIVTNLGKAGLAKEEKAENWRRIIIEKPFGRDLASARALNKTVHDCFSESQVYRIDHYLGKDTVQNILVFRFANTLFEPVWNHNYIDHVQITVSESVPVGSRGDYFDKAGVLRDMFQNHLLQLLALTAMEAPARFAADPLRNEKLKVLDAVELPTRDEAISNLFTGQYQGYRQEKGVDPNSRTPTFAALELQIHNWRWQGVPFYLRSGKALAGRSSEIVVQFHCPPHMMFPLPEGTKLECNRLGIFIQPDEGIYIRFQTKVPDQRMLLHPADLEFNYKQAYPQQAIPESYERLLQDALQGDAALFMRSDEIERAWEIMDPFIGVSEDAKLPRPDEYSRGVKTPPGADAFLRKKGREWIDMRA
jgi:glucose-6-phosphate 1-dehydrogenase